MRHTKYEIARMIAARALQLASGAQPLVKTKIADPVKVAKLEFEKGLIPLKVKRRYQA